MTGSRIYFDPKEARRRHFDLSERLRTAEGRTYELSDWIGRGGHGAVFCCVDRGSGDEFAVKFLLNRGRKPTKRFLREIRLLRSLENEHVVKIHGSGKVRAKEVDGGDQREIVLPFFVMDLADANLATVLAPDQRRPAAEFYMGQFRGLAGALADLHAVAIHRDIKPENILVQGDKWLLGDYGLCAFLAGKDDDITGDKEQVGPKYWLSPEGHNRRIGHDDTICPASDVYQLAAIFWYVVTGRHPSGNLTKEDWPGPEALFEPVYRALLHDKSRRPADGKEFLENIAKSLVT